MEQPTPSSSDTNNGDGKIPTLQTAPHHKPDSPIAKVAKRQQTLSEYVLTCLANYGLCVLDNFMGTVKASQILDDVLEMDQSGILKSGKTVQKEDEVKNVRKVDQDRIAFIQKNRSEGIDDLVYKLDNLVTHVQMKSKVDPAYANRKFIDVSGRTRAMVSCYPGNGTHYTRHVDNRHKDGRCVTVVYYLNKDWDVKTHGGMLKVYPQQTAPRIANIVPVFDRALIFWSDERNPHEVMPAFRSRYAVTVWYFDREERQKALERQEVLSGSGSGSSLSSTASAPNTTEMSSSAATSATNISTSTSSSSTSMH